MHLLSLNKSIYFQAFGVLGNKIQMQNPMALFCNFSWEVHWKILTEEVIHTCKEVAEVAQGFHTNVLIKYISSDEIIKYEEINDRLKQLKTIIGTQKIHLVFSVHSRKMMTADMLSGAFQQYFLNSLRVL